MLSRHQGHPRSSSKVPFPAPQPTVGTTWSPLTGWARRWSPWWLSPSSSHEDAPSPEQVSFLPRPTAARGAAAPRQVLTHFNTSLTVLENATGISRGSNTCLSFKMCSWGATLLFVRHAQNSRNISGLIQKKDTQRCYNQQQKVIIFGSRVDLNTIQSREALELSSV